jgi:hypothetical protein
VLFRYETLLVMVITALPTEPVQLKSQAPPPPAQSPEVLLMQSPEVQKELHLDKEQVQKIDELVRVVREKHTHDWDELRSLAPAERRRKQSDLAKTISQEIRRRLAEVLTPKQAKRLEQIRRQRQGLAAFTDPKVEKALHLSDEQKSKLKRINADAAQEARMVFRAGAPSSFPEKLTKIEAIGRKAVEKAVALLTDEQKKTWRELIGKPFAGQAEPSRIRSPN